MSEGKHTPGPWELEQEPHRYFWQIFGDYKLVASVPTGGNKNSDEQKARKRADAILVAAAPDLLEALERMIGKAYKQNWNDNYPEELGQAEAAIAKAKGES